VFPLSRSPKIKDQVSAQGNEREDWKLVTDKSRQYCAKILKETASAQLAFVGERCCEKRGKGLPLTGLARPIGGGSLGKSPSNNLVKTAKGVESLPFGEVEKQGKLFLREQQKNDSEIISDFGK